MPAFNKINAFVGDLGLKVHNLNSDAIDIYLSNTAPVATNHLFADVAEIAAGNGYTAGGNGITPAYSQTSGTGSLTSAASVVWTATGTVGPFRYVILYNATPTSPLKPLIGWWDYGSSIQMNTSGETFTVTFGANVLTIA